MGEEEKPGHKEGAGPGRSQKVGKARVQRAERRQIVVQFVALDEMVPSDHLVRVVWAMVGEMDWAHFMQR